MSLHQAALRCLTATLLALSGTAFAAAPEAPATIEDLDRQLAAILAEDHIPGASVALIEHGEVVFAKGYGFADVENKVAATADTPFRAGSISKSLTAIAVMTQVEQGKLSLDAPVARLLPDLHIENPWEKTEPVRLVHLLEHTTGWGDIGPKILVKDEKNWSVAQGVAFSQSDFVSHWQPGRYTNYNNAGPAVAALALEKTSGAAFDDYVRDQVLRPMGMARADFALPDDLAKGMAKSYEPDGKQTPYQFIVLKPAGSLTVSARELAQLPRFFLGRGTVDGRRILGAESIARIERGETNLGAKVGFFNAYGLGNVILPDRGQAFRGHNGSIDSFTAVMGYASVNGSGYVLMANGGAGVDFSKPAASLIQAYLTRDMPLAPVPPAKLDAAELHRFAGFYRTVSVGSALQRPYAELLGFSNVHAEEDRLTIGGRAFLPVDGHSFRREDRAEASVAFVEQDGDLYKMGSFGAQRKTPVWAIALVGLAGFALLATSLFGLVMVVPWLISALRGTLKDRGGLGVRLMPLGALASFVATFIMPFLVLQGDGSTAMHRLADVGAYSVTLFIASIAYPLFAVGGLVLAWRRGDAKPVVRWNTAIASLLFLMIALYGASIGWLPLVSWEM